MFHRSRLGNHEKNIEMGSGFCYPLIVAIKEKNMYVSEKWSMEVFRDDKTYLPTK